MKTKTWAMAALAAGLAVGPAAAQTTAPGRAVAGAPTAGTGTPRAGTGIPEPEVIQAPRRGATEVVPAGRLATPPGTMSDGLFAAAAAGAGLCELNLARLAAERGAGDDVKKFARQMIADHTKIHQELRLLAAERHMALPNAVPIAGQAEEVALAGLSGEAFDRCYIKQQLAAHISAVCLFEAEAERGDDSHLKAWAAKILPTLKHHLREVQAMYEKCEAREASGHAH
jgi:putative membrane protein